MNHANREVTAYLMFIWHTCAQKKIIHKKQDRKKYFVAEYCATEGPHRYVMWWVNIRETLNLATCSSEERALSLQTELLKLPCRCAHLIITWSDQPTFWTDGLSTSSCLLDYRPTQSISPSVWMSRLSVEPSETAVLSPLLFFFTFFTFWWPCIM